MSKLFQLSNTGKLAAIISMAMSCQAMASGITSVGDSTHRAAVSTAANGAQLVNIVTPNNKGLSHNTYSNYDVSHSGAVLNNSLSAGQSQLAGHLSANNKLQGHEAKIILNEVVSRNPSSLLGQQEVFGASADYVLANPNGISCNGCGFINTNKNALVVGKPTIEQGDLTGYNTSSSQQALNIGHKGIDGNQVLDLIAPKINVKGEVKAATSINAITGQNELTYTGQVINSQQEVSSLDSYYLGSMKAGTIRLVNTSAGSGINLQGAVTADALLAINSTGDLDIEGSKLHGNKLTIKSGKLNIRGKLTEHDTKWDDPENYHNYRGAIDHQKSTHSEAIVQSELSGKTISLSANEQNHITATNIQGDNINIRGASVAIDSQKLTNSKNEKDDRWFYSWSHNESDVSHQITQKTSDINAKANVSIASTQGDIDIVASTISAKSVQMSSADDIRLNGASTENLSEKKIQRKREGSALVTGHSAQIDNQQVYVPTSINSDSDLLINAQGNLTTLGTQIQASRDIEIMANGKVNITTGGVKHYRLDENEFTTWGGIGGGLNGKKEHDDLITTASNINAKGKTLVSGNKGVNIIGSKVHSTQGGYIQARAGAVKVDQATNTSSDTLYTRSGGAFNITGHSAYDATQQKQGSASNLDSDTNLTLTGDEHVKVTGSNVSAKDHLGIDSNGDVTIQAGQSQTDKQQHTSSIEGTASAGKVGDKQYSASVGITHKDHKESNHQEKHQANNINGGVIDINAANHVAINGAKINSSGDTNISGANVTIGSVSDTEHKTSTDNNVSVGISATGGINKGEIGINAGVTHQTSTEDSKQQIGTHTQIGGDLTINAQGNLDQTASTHLVSGDYNINAENVTNTAGIDSHSSNTSSNKTGIGVTVGADYSKTSKPLIEGAEKLLHGDVVGAGKTIKNTKVDLAEVQVGVTVNNQHTNDSTESSSVKGNSVHAGNININAQGEITDQGTHYQADKNININADSYRNESVNAHNEINHSQNTVDGSVAVGTKTGADISVHGKVKEHYASSGTIDNISNSGSIIGQDVTINANNSVTLEGTKVSGQQGVNITGGQEVNINQANDVHSSHSMDVAANIGVDVTTTGDIRNMGGAIAGHYQDTNSHDSTGNAGTISGGDINIHSGGNINSQGTNISGEQVHANADGKVDLTAASSSHSESSQHYGGDIHLGNSHNNKDNSFTDAIGGGLDLGHKSQSSSIETGSHISATGDISIVANGAAKDAVKIAGGDIKGTHTSINANNGGVDIHASSNASQGSDWNISASTNASEGYKQNDNPFNGLDKTTSIGGKIGVEISSNSSHVHANSQISGESVTINSQDDVNIKGGNIHSDKLSGNIGGDLNISSVKDQHDSHSIKGNIGVPNIKTTTSVDGKTETAKAPAKPITNADIKDAAIDIAKKLKDASISAGYESNHDDKVENQSSIIADDTQVNVAGTLTANGSKILSQSGSIAASSTNKQDIKGQSSHHKVNADALDIAKQLIGVGKGKPNFQHTDTTPVTVASITYGKAS